jgi:hypothetical protein
MFGSMPGFREVRYVASRGVAFIEYLDVEYAKAAKVELAGKIEREFGERVKLNYGK